MIKTLLLSAALLIGSVVAASSSTDPLCSIPTASLQQAATQYPTLSTALGEMLKYPIAIWYTDRESSDSLKVKLASMLSQCPSSSRIMLVVYGLPNKDCEAGYSSGGSNTNADDYRRWIQTLADGIGQRKVLYVLEPDAVGLLANGGCAVNYGYGDNVRTALSILSRNPNADIYLDVGYWTLLSATSATSVAQTVKTLATVGRLKGITLNSDNFRPTKQMADLCTVFQNAYGSKELNCIVDTSRNYNDNPPSTEWCNSRFGGIGRLPTTNTGYPNLDYLIWIKPAGESDGTCDGPGLTADAMKGPPAGQFFRDGFVSLWNNGYFVKEKNMAPVQ